MKRHKNFVKQLIALFGGGASERRYISNLNESRHSEALAEESQGDVSKLVSKEVSKNVIATNDFTSPLAGEGVRRTGEGAANNGTKTLGQEVTKNLCHSERSEESQNDVRKLVSKEVSKKTSPSQCKRENFKFPSLFKGRLGWVFRTKKPYTSPLRLVRGKKIAQLVRNDRNILLTYLPTNLLTCKRVAFTLAEMMVVLLIMTIVLAAAAPVMTTRHSRDNSQPWKWLSTNSPHAYFGNIPSQVAMIGQNNVPDATEQQAKLIINSQLTDHILFKNGNDILAKLHFTDTGMYLGSMGTDDAGAEATLGAHSVAVGYNVKATAKQSIAYGRSAEATGEKSTALGDQAYATAVNSTAVGFQTHAKGNSSSVFGRESVAIGDNAVALGSYNHVAGVQSIAIGSSRLGQGWDDSEKTCETNANYSIGIGNTETHSNYAITIGHLSLNYADNSIVLGMGVEEGKVAVVRTGSKASIAIGNIAQVNEYSQSSIAIGDQAGVIGKTDESAGSPYSIAIGYTAKVETDSESGIAIGNTAETSGVSAIAIGKNANAVNTSAIAIGTAAQAEAGNVAIGKEAYSLGTNSVTIGGEADGSGYSTTIGYQSATYGYSVALGRQAKAGSSSTAIGAGALAGYSSFADDAPTSTNDIAIGGSSSSLRAIAYGGGTIAIGAGAKVAGAKKAIALGYQTQATGDQAVAIGNGSTASGEYSMAIGYNVSADASNEIVIGGSNPVQNVRIPEDLHVGGAIHGTLANVSDRRLKNVGKEFTFGLDKIRELKVFNFTYKDDKTKTPRVGVIAQDLQKVFPSAVKKDAKGYLSVRMEDMFYAVVNAIKELDAKVTTLFSAVKEVKTENEQLKKRCNDLEKRLEALEQKVK